MAGHNASRKSGTLQADEEELKLQTLRLKVRMIDKMTEEMLKSAETLEAEMPLQTLMGVVALFSMQPPPLATGTLLLGNLLLPEADVVVNT